MFQYQKKKKHYRVLVALCIWEHANPADNSDDTRNLEFQISQRAIKVELELIVASWTFGCLIRNTEKKPHGFHWAALHLTDNQLNYVQETDMGIAEGQEHVSIKCVLGLGWLKHLKRLCSLLDVWVITYWHKLRGVIDEDKGPVIVCFCQLLIKVARRLALTIEHVTEVYSLWQFRPE